MSYLKILTNSSALQNIDVDFDAPYNLHYIDTYLHYYHKLLK